MWVCGSDDLVDGRKLIRRFEEGKEPEVEVVWKKVIEEYEHLDVVWAVDARKRVFEEVAEVVRRCGEVGEGVVERRV
jgi:predicted transcriptional regulator